VVTSRFVFIHRFLIDVNIVSTKSGILHPMLGVFIHVENLMSWLSLINRGEFVNLCNTISLKFENEGDVSCTPICILLPDCYIICSIVP
jgi:hypothetical protein